MPGSRVFRAATALFNRSVLNRVNEVALDTNRPRKSLKELQLLDLLPDQASLERLKHRCAVLVSGIISKYLTKFHPFRDVVIRHILHHYSKEMKTNSQTCSLGVQFFNPNVASEMTQLLMTNHEKYVSSFKTTDGKAVLKSVPFHGDQLFEERARNTQWVYQDGDNEYDRLEGLETEFADWHAKFIVTGSEVEPLVQQARELESAVAAAGFLCQVDGCDKNYSEHSSRVKHEVMQHGIVWEQYEAGKERDIMGFYHCRMSCGLVFSTKSTRNRHESTAHSGTTVQTEQDGSGKEGAKEDFLFNYHQANLTFGLILFEFGDAIKEGDGDRLHDFYRFGLLLFQAYGKTKYAYVILLYLAKIKAILSESDAHDLKWNRTFNKHGLPGMNIPLDLRTEQYNRDVKGMWKALGANINEDSAARVANTVEPMENIYDSIRSECGLPEIRGYRSGGNPEVAAHQLICDLMQISAFKHNPGRGGHPSFPEFSSNLLQNLDYRDLHTWMNGLIKTWEPIYELNRV